MAPTNIASTRVPPLRYGDRLIQDFLPERVLADGRLIPLKLPGGEPKIRDVDAALLSALESSSTPDSAPGLGQWMETRYRGGEVSIVIDDHTRPCVHQRRLLPGLLEWLPGHRVDRDRISIVVATATHRAPRPDELPYVLGEAAAHDWWDRVFPHRDEEDLEWLGAMPDGTPIELNGRAARSELIVSLSDLDYHYFAGVTGGLKHLVPGIAGRGLTTADHLRMFGELGFARNCDMGILDGNPVYEYKREAVRRILAELGKRGTFVYAVISVLDPAHRFVALEGGDIVELHRKLRHVLDRVYAVEIPRLADVAIVSARHLGINVYQAAKAVNTAARAVRKGGTVVCLAPCPDGFGNEEFRDLMSIAATILREGKGKGAIDRALGAVQEAAMKEFRIGKQKPVDLLVQYRHVGRGNLWLLSDGLDDDDLKRLPFRAVGERGEDPAERLRAWVEGRERTGRPTYAIVDDPTYWIRPTAGP